MFSSRAQWAPALNRLTLARRARRGELLDLTETNPTRTGIDYPLDELSEALAHGARASYDPDPRGLLSAREALAGHLGCSAEDLLLTASTSEAYSFLFKLLTDPGDAVLIPTPSYPLLEHLASLESVNLLTFPLEFHRRWEIHDVSAKGVKAIVVVNPNNPTGSFVTREEQDRLAALGVPIISDEVFLDYPLEAPHPRFAHLLPLTREKATELLLPREGEKVPKADEGAPAGTTFVRDEILTFTLGGLSKSAGLPHYKLAWIRASGPGKREALDALELIADNFLSVATPVQAALPDLLRIASRIRDAIRARTQRNLATLRAAATPSVQVLPVEGGWSAVLRVPRTMPDEELALQLLERGVLVQPGYFFDFASEGYLVLSLLTREEIFAAGVARVMEHR